MKKSLVKDILESEFEYLMNNFRKDRDINVKEGNNIDCFLDFLSYINKETLDIDDSDFSKSKQQEKEACMENLNKAFFHDSSFHRKGKERDCEDINHQLGHVVGKKQLLNDLQTIINENLRDPAFSNIDMNTIRKKLLQNSNVELSDFEDLSEIRIRKYQMWCFSNGKNKSLLDGHEPEDLSLKLALQDTTCEKFLFEVGKPEKNSAFKPTVFDAGFGELWEPGGYTVPIGKFKGTKGLEEVLVEKLNYEHITSVMSIGN